MRLGITVAGVSVKAWLCECGCLVFAAPPYGTGMPLVFDAEAAPDLYEMVSGNNAVFYRAHATGTYRVHFCPVELALEVDE